MATAEVQLPSGETTEIDVPEGANPETFIPHAMGLIRRQRGMETQMQQENAMPGPRSVEEIATSALSQVPSALWEGVKTVGKAGRALASPLLPPGMRGEQDPLLQQLKDLAGGAVSGASGGFVNPGAPEGEAPSSDMRALGQVAGSAIPFAGISRLARALGIPLRSLIPLISTGAGAVQGGMQGGREGALEGAITGGASAAAGAALTQGALSGAKLAAKPAQLPLQEADQLTRQNIATNAANRRAFEQASRAHQELLQRQRQEVLMNQQARRAQAGLISERERAMMDAIRTAPQPDAVAQAYKFMNDLDPATGQPVKLPDIKLPNLAREASAKASQIEALPAAIGGKKAPQFASEMEGQVAGGAGPELTIGGKAIPADLQARVMEQLGITTAGGKAVNLRQVQDLQQGLGMLSRQSNDPRVYGLARHFYKNLMQDLEEAAKATPEARKFLDASKVFKTQMAAEELADWATSHGTGVNKTTGEFMARPEAIKKFITSPDSMFKHLPAEVQSEIASTVESVFDARKGMPPIYKPKKGGLQAPKPRKILPEVIEPARAEGWLARHPIVAASVASSGFGLPIGAGIGIAVAYPRLIFRIATSPRGRQFLRSLYSTEIPNVNDAARYAAMVGFLKSQGESVQGFEELVQPQPMQQPMQAPQPQPQPQPQQ